MINKKIPVITTIIETKHSHVVDMGAYVRFTQKVILKKTETLMTRRNQLMEIVEKSGPGKGTLYANVKVLWLQLI